MGKNPVTISMRRPRTQYREGKGHHHYDVRDLYVTSDRGIGGWSPASLATGVEKGWQQNQVAWPQRRVRDHGADYRNELRRFSRFEQNWDSYEALPFDDVVLERTRRVVGNLVRVGIPEPKLIPAASGSIILEWWTDFLRLEIDIDPEGEDSVFVELQDNSMSTEYVGHLSEITNGHRRVLNTALTYLAHLYHGRRGR